MNDQFDELATLVMRSTRPGVGDYHRLAASAAATAANPNLDQRTRQIYKLEEAKNLLQAVFAHDPTLFSHVMLSVAANIAERADA
jgi:hypothetical protein